MDITESPQALTLIAWSQIWSQHSSAEQRTEAWRQLDLPDTWLAHAEEYGYVFHHEDKDTPIPLRLHCALDLPIDTTREALLDDAGKLGLNWDGVQTAPDHLAAVCEIAAYALEQDEVSLVQRLIDQYLLGWCEVAEQALLNSGSSMEPVVEKFSLDLENIAEQR